MVEASESPSAKGAQGACERNLLSPRQEAWPPPWWTDLAIVSSAAGCLQGTFFTPQAVLSPSLSPVLTTPPHPPHPTPHPRTFPDRQVSGSFPQLSHKCSPLTLFLCPETSFILSLRSRSLSFLLCSSFIRILEF